MASVLLALWCANSYRNSISHGARQSPVLVPPESICQQRISSRLHKRQHSCSATAQHVDGSLHGKVSLADLQQVPGSCCILQPAVDSHGLGAVDLIHQLLDLWPGNVWRS